MFSLYIMSLDTFYVAACKEKLHLWQCICTGLHQAAATNKTTSLQADDGNNYNAEHQVYILYFCAKALRTYQHLKAIR